MTDADHSGRSVDISGGQGAVVGDYATVFQYFTAAPAPLSAHIRIHDFRGVVDDRVRSFVGRGFVFDAIDNAVSDDGFPSGYIVLQGEPGIGKTAALAHLIRTRGYVHHLNIAPLGLRSPAAFLANVCAQIVVRYGLDHGFLPDMAIRDGGFLSRVLAEAAADAANRPVIVVVDALDEAEHSAFAGANRLFLPSSLPAGVFFLVSTRPSHDTQLYVDARRDVYLRDDDPRNVTDVMAYVTEFLQSHRTGLPLDAGAREGFADALVERSEGNFMYVVHVLREVLQGSIGVDDVRALPQGLRAYYRRHWSVMRDADPDRFTRYQEPVVCLLATAREGVTAQQTAEWARQYWAQSGWDVAAFRPRMVIDVLRDWQEFLNAEQNGGATRFRIYHASFQDFLREEIGLDLYHAAIGDSALSKIPDFLTATTDEPS